jgi:carbon monoxide dehydrogenase subunit G
MVELEGIHEIDAPRELVWDMVRDPEVLARVMPGCEKLEVAGANEFRGKMRIKVGPVDGVFQGTVTFSDLQPVDSFHFVVSGRGPSGIVRGEGDLLLAETETGSNLSYKGNGQVSGRMATVGQRLMTSSANAITKQCLHNLDRQIQARLQPQPAADGAPQMIDSPVPEAPSQSEFLMGVARELLDEYVPDPGQRKMLMGLAMVPVVLGLVNLFANLVARKVVKMMREEAE